MQVGIRRIYIKKMSERQTKAGNQITLSHSLILSHRGVIRSNRHYFGIQCWLQCWLILSKITVWTNQSPAHSRGCVILLKMRRERQTELNPKIVTVASNHATVHVRESYTKYEGMTQLRDCVIKSHSSVERFFCLWSRPHPPSVINAQVQ